MWGGRLATLAVLRRYKHLKNYPDYKAIIIQITAPVHGVARGRGAPRNVGKSVTETPESKHFRMEAWTS